MTVGSIENVVSRSQRHLVGEGSQGNLPPQFPPDGYGRHIFVRSLLDRRRSFADIRDAKRPSGVSRSEHIKAGIELTKGWDLAKRSMNGQDQLVRYGAAANPESYAHTIEIAVEHPALSDHNRQHERRVRLHVEALLHNIGEVRHETHILDFLPSAAAFAPRHDRIQLLRQYENLAKPPQERLSPKYTHATGGAILDLLEVREYAAASGSSIDQARKVKRASAYMIMKHDEPQSLTQALNGTLDAQRLPQGVDLFTAYNNNILDLTTLSPAQLLAIHVEQASKMNGFVTAETPHGLPLIVEKQYAHQLVAMANDTMPLLPDISPEERRTLNVLTEINVVADVMDMIAPPEESLARKLLVPRSRTRPFYRPEISSDELIAQAMGHEGNLPTEVGNDVARALWEYSHALDMFPNGVVSKSPYAKRVIGKAIIQGGMALEELGTYLMNGENLHAPSSPIQRVYNRRIKQMGEKALRKAEMLNGSNDIAHRFRGKVLDLLAERDELVATLIPKQVREDGTPFTAEDINQFRNVVDTVTNELCRRYGVSDVDREKYRAEMNAGKYTAPYSAYDSLAMPQDSRTIFHIGDLAA